MNAKEHAAMVDHAKDIIDLIEAAKSRAMKDERSTARYWNCDDWGSITGIRDADEWVRGEVANTVAIHLHKIGAKP